MSESGFGGGGGIHVKVLNNIYIFFHLIEKFRVVSQDDHMRKRRTTVERCQGVRGWRIPQSLQSAEVLSGEIPCTKTCLRTEPGLPALLPLSAMYTMKSVMVKAKAACELVPK